MKQITRLYKDTRGKVIVRRKITVKSVTLSEDGQSMIANTAEDGDMVISIGDQPEEFAYLLSAVSTGEL